MTRTSSVPRATPRLRAPLAALIAAMAVIAAGFHSATPATKEAATADFSTLAGMVSAQAVGVDLTDLFLKVDGIEGVSVRDGHENEIEFSSMRWGVSNGAANGATAGKPVFANLTLASTNTAKAGPPLMQAAASGRIIKQATLSARWTVEGETRDFLVITLSDVIVSSYEIGSDVPNEEIELSFSKIVIDYDDGTARAGWDLKAGRPL